MRRLLAYALRRDGYAVVEVEALVLEQVGTLLLESDAGDVSVVIVSDLRMPRLSGMEVLRVLRAANQSTPFLLITAFGDRDVHAEARRPGASVLDKPFPIADFRMAVRRLVAPSPA